MTDAGAAALDHVVVLADDLADAVRWARSRLGVDPLPGGSHPGFGTRNAVVPLHGGAYLELLAPDPAQEGGPWATQLAELDGPILGAWAVRVPDARTATRALMDLGLATRTVRMSRRRPDGSVLRWEIVWIGGPAPAPFAIAWSPAADPERGGRAHPSMAGPPQAAVTSVEIATGRLEDTDTLRAISDTLGLEGVTVGSGRSDRIRVRLETPKGDTALEGAPRPLRPADL